jgi:transposase
MFIATPLVLDAEARADLETVCRASLTPQAVSRRARCVLLLADGLSYAVICTRLGVTDRFIARWQRRYREGGILALTDAHRAGRQDHRLSPALEAKVLHRTQYTKPPAPLTHWSARRLAAAVGTSASSVLNIWRRAGLQPHRRETYMASPDPDFETKAADIIGLYLHPPQHAVVLAVDEKTNIQALDRRDPVLPLSPGRAERYGFEYVRHGTVSLYAALDVATGEVTGQPTARHRTVDFLAFLTPLCAGYPDDQEIHVILDNFAAHKTAPVQQWLAAHPQVHFHFTPTYSSWLNQVELWFAKIERDVIARGIFTSTADLARKLMQYIKLHNTTAEPFDWKYQDPTRRIRAIKN